MSPDYRGAHDDNQAGRPPGADGTSAAGPDSPTYGRPLGLVEGIRRLVPDTAGGCPVGRGPPPGLVPPDGRGAGPGRAEDLLQVVEVQPAQGQEQRDQQLA